jgi:hydroxymethylbilane synthase
VLVHAATRVAIEAERAFSRRLGGSCQSPIAAHARVAHGRVILDGLVAEPDGSRLLRETLEGAAADSVALGGRLAERVLAAGAGALLERLRTG